MIDEIIFGINVISLLLLLISIFIISLSKRFEKENAKNVVNIILIALLFTLIVIGYDTLMSAIVFTKISSLLGNIPLDIISLIIELTIIPIIALCFLASLLYLRELKNL
ncbi:hypothetical protein HYX17_04645 [Candidatus Woesearchaeota archaeon]|nr:hypothetical protein [Candidatus Woesearchaeota archaeon]